MKISIIPSLKFHSTKKFMSQRLRNTQFQLVQRVVSEVQVRLFQTPENRYRTTASIARQAKQETTYNDLPVLMTILKKGRDFLSESEEAKDKALLVKIEEAIKTLHKVSGIKEPKLVSPIPVCEINKEEEPSMNEEPIKWAIWALNTIKFINFESVITNLNGTKDIKDMKGKQDSSRAISSSKVNLVDKAINKIGEGKYIHALGMLKELLNIISGRRQIDLDGQKTQETNRKHLREGLINVSEGLIQKASDVIESFQQTNTRDA